LFINLKLRGILKAETHSPAQCLQVAITVLTPDQGKTLRRILRRQVLVPIDLIESPLVTFAAGGRVVAHGI
jgi:hypothetical protein